MIKLNGGIRILGPSYRSEPEKLVVIVAGEASADLHGSNLVKAIMERAPGVHFVGVGGRRMEEAGVRIIATSDEMAVVGVSEVFSRLRTISKVYFQLKSILRRQRPDLLILIDYPDFNLLLAKQAKKYGVPVLYYISPQVWAWRSGRVKKIAKRVDRLAVILPFEEEFFRQRGVKVDYVGHPLLDKAKVYGDQDKVKQELGLKSCSPVLAILPGSRYEEVQGLLPAMLQAAEIVAAEYRSLACVLPLAPTIDRGAVTPLLDKAKVRVKLFHGDIYKALCICDAGMVSSGTATLEMAIAGVPMVIAYKVSPISYWIGKRVVKVEHIGLVNLVAGKEVVPELIQEDVTGPNLAQALFPMLEGEHREKIIGQLVEVRKSLGKGGASGRTAELALKLMY